MRKCFTTVLGVALGLGGLGCSVLDDPSFDLICTDSSCPWQVETGSVRKVPTWHENDEGLELLDRGTTISQLVSDPLDCPLELELFGLVDRDARLSVAIDAEDDGTLDAIATIPELDWESTTFTFDVPAVERFRIVITKAGSGQVVLGHVYAEECPAPDA